MSNGLQVFKANGELQIDISSKLQRVVARGVFTCASGQHNYVAYDYSQYMNYFFSVPGLVLDGTYFAECFGAGWGQIVANGVNITMPTPFGETTYMYVTVFIL